MIGDGENVNHLAKTKSMDDVGTRQQHLADLYELWVTGLDILECYDKHLPLYEEKKAELTAAKKLLFFHMVKDYDIAGDKKMIDELPKADLIKE